jgi:hypothetical protein
VIISGWNLVYTRVKATVNSDWLTQTTNIKLVIDIVMKEIEKGTYKYLGMNEGYDIQHAIMKEKIRIDKVGYRSQ